MNWVRFGVHPRGWAKATAARAHMDPNCCSSVVTLAGHPRLGLAFAYTNMGWKLEK